MSVTQTKKSKQRANCFYSKMKKNENGGEKILHVHCLQPIDNFAISAW